MIVDMPELLELRILESNLEYAITNEEIIKAKNALDVFWIKLKREVEEKYNGDA